MGCKDNDEMGGESIFWGRGNSRRFISRRFAQKKIADLHRKKSNPPIKLIISENLRENLR
jgi:hypothetical protein